MSPANFDLLIYCGTTVDESTMLFTYKVGGEPVDLTGYTARSQGLGGHGVLFDLSTENGGIVLGGLAGTVALHIDAATTAAMKVDGLVMHRSNFAQEVFLAGKWDLKLIAPGGRVVRLLQGKVLLSPEVTA